jgi:type IV pilus assembly protein PilV
MRAASTTRHRQRGFSMIEVLIALVLLAVGLLGYALLQTMSLRFTQSANLRTQATTLAYDLLDQMRANRFAAGWYSTASFNAGEIDTTAATCNPATGAVTVQAKVQRWQCQVVRTLGPTARAQVAMNNGNVNVQISWNDDRWKAGTPDPDATFSLTTRL